jgi:phosphoenolpyruvate carboxykinase (ATP)
MKEYGIKSSGRDLASIGFEHIAFAYWNLSQEELISKITETSDSTITDTGAVAVTTGMFTGRSPKDRFIVCDSETEHSIDWGEINQKYSPEHYKKLYQSITHDSAGKTLYIKDVAVCADPEITMHVRVISELPWQSLFVHNLFLRKTPEEIQKVSEPDWLVIAVPYFFADPKVHGTRSNNATVINFTERTVLICGSAYAGEIKKSIFSVLNYLLPKQKQILPMHCSANMGEKGDTAIFFGLSGTGKTTLSADPNRKLIGDDEHGWSENSVFNFEGGCYAKCAYLSQEKEPQIWGAIRDGAILENIEYIPGTRTVDYSSIKKTENTRAAYRIDAVSNALKLSVGGVPKNIFFLTCDAYGVLPPVAKLTKNQALYYFLSGYTAKVAGTEVGVTEPQATFSACFGKAFLPLDPTVYAKLLGKKLDANPDISVWLINTGWTGGSYGEGSRMPLPNTRSILAAALSGELKDVEYETMPFFNLQIPKTAPLVDSKLLNPRNTWSDQKAYDKKAKMLAALFVRNFEQYITAPEEIRKAGPMIEE